MRLITAAFFAASLTSLALPAAAGDRVSDANYLKAARCQGLAHATGGTDTSGIDAFVQAQGEKRDPRLRNQARAARADAEREAQSEAKRARLTAELNGRCAAWTGTTQVAASTQAGN
jgi:hypothetical protein